MKVGVQGQIGSACESAAATLIDVDNYSLEYFHDAKEALAALEASQVSHAVLALESPVGVNLLETQEAIRECKALNIVKELCLEVHHCLMVRPNTPRDKIKVIASHPIPLEKHESFLAARFPGYRTLVCRDTGDAARQLAEGELANDVAVIAMPNAAKLFGLEVLKEKLPANNDYLTKFALVEILK